VTTAPVLYHIVCAAPPARDAARMLRVALDRGWDVCLIATPHAAAWLDHEPLERLTGHPIRSRYKLPDEPDVLPPADAMVVAPATFNSINKWAAGISDTLALGLLAEAIGLGLPLVAVPHLNAAQARHPAFGRSIAALRDCGVTVLYGPEAFTALEPGETYAAEHERDRWRLALDAIDTLRQR
jgi:phosphopantothenoylcysteine synthetase/decarboxylase